MTPSVLRFCVFVRRQAVGHLGDFAFDEVKADSVGFEHLRGGGGEAVEHRRRRGERHDDRQERRTR
jgi:hypothetical protein